MSLKETQQVEEIEEEEINEEIEKEIEKPIKPIKKPRSQKQIDVLEKGRKKMLENSKLRAIEKKNMEEDSKKSYEKALVKKALEIKKKQIIRESLLDDISDDETDTPLEKIKNIIKKKPIKEFPSVIVPSVSVIYV